MSVNIMSMVKDAVSQQVMNKIGGMIGLDQSQTSSAFETAAGSILGGLIGKSVMPGGADQIFEAAQQQDTGILDKLGDLLGGGEATDNLQKQGGGILDMVFGQTSGTAQQAVGSTLGLGEGIVGKLMAMAAPILMSVIGNYVKSKALNAVGLGSLLGEQKQHLAGLLPSNLTGSLGLGDMLGNVTGAASNLAGAASGAASNVANAATGAANDAVEAGGGLLKKILPVGILGAVLLGLWGFVISPMINGGGVGDAINNVKDGVAGAGSGLTAGMGDLTGGLELPEGLDLSVLGETKDQLMNPINEIKNGFGDLATGGEGAATGLADKISGFGTALEGMGIGDMGGAQKTAVSGILGSFTGVLEGLVAKVPEPLQAIVKPAVDGLLEKIKGFGL